MPCTGGFDVFSGVPTLASISKAFANPYAMAAGWAHYLTFDIFVGRWILFDSIKNRVFAVHSLLLANLLGPVGLLSHLVLPVPCWPTCPTPCDGR